MREVSGPINVLYLTDLAYLGGGEKSLLGLMQRLHSPFVPLVGCPPGGPFLEALRQAGFSPQPIRYGLARKWGGFLPVVSPRTIWQVARLIRSRRVSLVHAYTLTAAKFAAPAARLSGIPCVMTLHTWDFPLGLVGKMLEGLIDRTIAVSEGIRQHCIHLGGDPHKTVTIYNGVDLSSYHQGQNGTILRQELGLGDGPVIGMVARLHPVKGYECFLRAAALVGEKVPQARFLVVGTQAGYKADDGSYELELKALAEQLGLSQQVIFTGFRTDVPEILPALDVFILSSGSESQGLALIEAMAAGCPVVATATQGAREILEPGHSGILVPVDDHQALARAVLDLLADPARRAELAGAARVRAQAFDMEAMVRRVEEIYQALLARRGR